MCPGDKESDQTPGLHWAVCCQQVEGWDPSPLLSAGETQCGVLGPVLGSPVQKRHRHTGSSPVKAP